MEAGTTRTCFLLYRIKRLKLQEEMEKFILVANMVQNLLRFQ
jgi:hypothetical protein